MHGVATFFGDAVPVSIHALQVLIVRACPIKRLFCSRFFLGSIHNTQSVIRPKLVGC